MTDIVAMNVQLAKMAIAIGVVSVGFVVVAAVMVGARISWGTYQRNLVRWATDDVRLRNQGLVAQLAEERRASEVLREELARERREHEATRARIKGALKAHGQVASILTEVGT